MPNDDLPPGTSGATSCLIDSDMYIFGGYTMTGNVNAIYRIDLSPLTSSDTHDDRERTVTVEKIRPANAEDSPIPSDKNVSWSHEGKFFVFGGYGYEPERGDRYRRLMPRDSLFLPDPGSHYVSPPARPSPLTFCFFLSKALLIPVVAGTTSWPASTRILGSGRIPE